MIYLLNNEYKLHGYVQVMRGKGDAVLQIIYQAPHNSKQQGRRVEGMKNKKRLSMTVELTDRDELPKRENF